MGGQNPAALGEGGDYKYIANGLNKEILERFNTEDIRAVSNGRIATEDAIANATSENSRSQLRMSPNRQCISPPRLMSTTSNIPLISNLPMTESFERQENANKTLPSRLNSSINLPMTSTMVLKEAPISERFSFPTPPPQPPIDSIMPNKNNIKLKKVISRPNIQLVGDESDASSLPRSPYENNTLLGTKKLEVDPRQDSNNPHSVSNKSDSELTETSKPRTMHKSLKRPDSLSHLAVQNQLKMLKPLPSSAERRLSLAERRNVTPVGKK